MLIQLEEMEASKRAQYYEMREESGFGTDDSRYVLMTPDGMAAFQPCEFVFSATKFRLARLPIEASTLTSTEHGIKAALEALLKSMPKKVVKGSLRAAEHFREAWLAGSHPSKSGEVSLSLQKVRELIYKNRLQLRSQRPRPNRDVGSYESEL